MVRTRHPVRVALLLAGLLLLGLLLRLSGRQVGAWGGGRPVDLGVVLVPPQGQPAHVHVQEWHALSLRPGVYRVGHGLSPEEEARLQKELQALAHRLRYRALPRERFVFEAPASCMEDMRCVYQALLEASAPAVAPLADRFAQRTREAGLTAPEAAELILTYVQALPYQVPEEEPFGVLPPALVSARGWGDCDSKALLALLLLERVGVRSVLLTAPTLHHAAVGVALPGPGLALRYGSEEFRYAEVTSAGWPIGLVPPMHDVPRAWRVVPLRVPGWDVRQAG